MSASWCKVASNLDSHPKIRRAGRNGREVFLFALRRNAEPNNKRRGFVAKEQLEPWYIADQLQMPETDAVDGLARACMAGLIREEPDAWAIVGWDDREWGKFAKDGAERTADWRKRKAANVGDDFVTVRDGGDGCDGIDQKRRDETRSEKKQEGGLFDISYSSPPAPATTKKSRKRTNAVQLPDGWVPGPYVVPNGVDAQRELERFRNHAQTNGRTAKDWQAAWRNWLLKAEEFARPTSQSRPVGRAEPQPASAYEADIGKAF